MNYTRLRTSQSGQINALLIPLVLSVLLLFGAIGFGAWAFTSRQDYKDNVDSKVVKAVEIAKKETETAKDNEFTEREKEPLKDYRGPSQFGSVIIKYPKTWSGYVDDTGRSTAPVDGYFYPSTVPGIQSETSYALRLQVVNRDFSTELRSYDSAVKQGTVKVESYKPKNVPDVVGAKLQGEIASKKQGILIMLPLRDKTIKIYTESDKFYNDFNTFILPNFTFTP